MLKHLRKLVLAMTLLGVAAFSVQDTGARASEQFFEEATSAQLDIIRGSGLVSEADINDVRVMNLNIMIIFRIENEVNCRKEVCRSYIFQPAVRDKFTGVFFSERLYRSDHLRTDKLSHPNLAEMNFLFKDGRPQARIHFNFTELEFVFVTPEWPED